MFVFLESERFLFSVYMSSISELARITASAVASYSRDRDHMASDEAWPPILMTWLSISLRYVKENNLIFGTSNEDYSVPVTSAK